MQQACLSPHSQEETHKCFCLTAHKIQHYNFYFSKVLNKFLILFFAKKNDNYVLKSSVFQPWSSGALSCMFSMLPCLSTPGSAHHPGLQRPDNGSVEK